MNLRHPKGRAAPLVIALAVAFQGFISVPAPLNAVTSAEVQTQRQVVDEALSDLRTCLSLEGAILDVYYLIDNSKSMREIGSGTGTDVAGLRYQAVESSLQPLIELSGQGTPVNVAAGLFSKEGQTLVSWTPLDSGSVGLPAKIRETLGRVDAGGGTNWVNGLAEAQRQLDQQSATGGTHCQTLVWVTDGGIDIVRDPVQTAQGVEDLCGVSPTDFESAAATTGLMYSLRNMGVVVLGVLLQDPENFGDDLEDGQLSERISKTSYFRPVVEGSGTVDATYFNDGDPLSGSFNCGAVVDGAQGATITIASADEIAREFQQLVTCIADSCTVLPPSLVVCENGVCEIPIPRGIAELQIAVPRGFNPDNVLLPSGTGACLTGGCTTESEAGDRIYVRIPVKNVAGVWKIRTDADSVSPLLFSGLSIESDPIVVNPIVPKIDSEIRLEQEAGAVFDSENYTSDFNWNARITFSNGESEAAEIRDSGGTWRLIWNEEGRDTNGLIPTGVEVGLGVTAASPSPDVPELQLAEIVGNFAVTKENLEKYPSLISPNQSESLTFTPIEGLEGEGLGTILIKGPLSNDGAICWKPNVSGILGQYEDSANRPSGSLSAQIKTDISGEVVCPDGKQGVLAPQGEEVAIDIGLKANPQDEAVVKGVLNFEFYGPEGEKGFSQDIPFTVKTSVVKSEIAFWIVLAILTLLGIGLPYLGLVLLARRQAAFSSKLDGTRWASLAAIVGQDGLVNLEEKEASKYEFIFVEKNGITRKIETGGEVHEIIPPGLWPFRPAKTVVRSSNGSSIFTNHDGEFVNGRNTGVSSQVLGNVFYFVADPVKTIGQEIEVALDDWGNPVQISGASESVASEELRTGRLVVLAPGDTNPVESISRSLAKVRTWSGWQSVYIALSQGSAETSVKAQKTKKEKSTIEAADQSGSATNVTGFANEFDNSFGFGAPHANDEDPKSKKSKFGKKKGNDRSSESDHGDSGGSNLSDW